MNKKVIVSILLISTQVALGGFFDFCKGKGKKTARVSTITVAPQRTSVAGARINGFDNPEAIAPTVSNTNMHSSKTAAETHDTTAALYGRDVMFYERREAELGEEALTGNTLSAIGEYGARQKKHESALKKLAAEEKARKARAEAKKTWYKCS